MDWLAFGLPAEGEAQSALLIEHIQRTVPTCRPTDSAEAARQAAAKMNFSSCAIVNEENVVLGSIRNNGSEVDPVAAAADVMELGPKTLRPSSTVKEAKQIAQKTGRTEILVTSSDGKLIGVFKAAGQEKK